MLLTTVEGLAVPEARAGTGSGCPMQGARRAIKAHWRKNVFVHMNILFKINKQFEKKEENFQKLKEEVGILCPCLIN